MNSLYDIKEMLMDEADEIARKGSISTGDLDMIQKLTESIKNILKIDCLEDDGYSGDGGWHAEGTYSRKSGSDRERDRVSYGRHWVRGHYSADDGRENMMAEMKRMVDGGSLSDKQKNVLREAMDLLK